MIFVKFCTAKTNKVIAKTKVILLVRTVNFKCVKKVVVSKTNMCSIKLGYVSAMKKYVDCFNVNWWSESYWETVDLNHKQADTSS